MFKKIITLVFLIITIPAYSAGKNAIATGHVEATEAAAVVLKQGGNAVDAMVAASFVLNVTQPYKMGIGGGGFMLVSNQGKTWFLDHREEAPLSAHEKMFLDGEGKVLPDWPDAVTGPNPVGIPGTVAGLYDTHKKFGKTPWKKLLDPAIKLARDGFAITTAFENELSENWERLVKFPITASIFGDGEGSYLKRGRILRQPLLAATIQKIADKGASEFYTGDLAKTWIASARKEGVKITLDDLKNYKPRITKTVKYPIFGFEAETAPPPSSSGLLLAGVLRYLEHYYKTHEIPEIDSAQRIIITSEAMLHFQKMRNENLADVKFTKIEPEKFIGSKEEITAWKEIDERIKKRIEKISTSFVRNLTSPMFVSMHDYRSKIRSLPESSNTAHFSIVDAHGMSVAYTTTIEEIFGSGITVPGHGFLLNNELSDFTHTPGHVNSAIPGKRPRSNMSPTILFEKNKTGSRTAIAVVGAAGGLRIPTSVAEFLENYYIHKLNARAALAFTRFHPSEEGKIEVEKGLPEKTIKLLKEAGYTVEVVPQMWSVAQMIVRRNATSDWEVANEPRYDGMGLSF